MTALVDAPARADGLQLLGTMVGSGYREPPALVRRGDGQTLQLTPLLYAVLDAIDGRRSAHEVATLVREAVRREVTEELLGQGTKILLPAATPVVSIGTATVDGALVSLATRGGRQIVRVDGRAFELGAVVEVTMTAGPAELDPSVRDACMIAATAAYGAFVFDPNVAGEGVDGVFSGGFSQFGPGALPLAARTILTPLRRPVLL